MPRNSKKEILYRFCEFLINRRLSDAGMGINNPIEIPLSSVVGAFSSDIEKLKEAINLLSSEQIDSQAPLLEIFNPEAVEDIGDSLGSGKKLRVRYKRKEKEKYEKNLESLKKRKKRLLEMRINEEISKEEFLDSKTKIENQMALTEVSMKEPEIGALDIKVVMRRATEFIGGIVSFWKRLKEVKQKQRLQ